MSFELDKTSSNASLPPSLPSTHRPFSAHAHTQRSSHRLPGSALAAADLDLAAGSSSYSSVRAPQPLQPLTSYLDSA